MAPSSIGRYEIKGELGRGGMAVVYQAHDGLFARDVALKVLPRELLHNPSFRARFEREARLIAAIEHPAIVPVHDVGEDEGQPYLVMRMMRGGSLADRMRQGALRLPEVARILAALAPALDRAHAKGVIHRDLKPSNILFDEDGNPYVADFGIARLAEDLASMTITGLIGTPAYMSPEQASGEKRLDARSDLYALGVIVFQMLSGQLPYEADTPIGMAMKHVNAALPHIRDLRPDLPPTVEGIMQRALAKAPEARYASALRFADDIATLPAGSQAGTDDGGQLPATEVKQTGPTGQPGPKGTRQDPAVGFWRRGLRRGLAGVLLLLASLATGLLALAVLALLALAVLASTARSQTPPPGATRPPLTAAPTLIAATVAASATATLTPTPAPTATALPTPTPTGPPPIGPENASELVLVASLEQEAAIYTLAFSPNGHLLAAGGTEGFIRLWDAETRQALRRLDGHTALVRHLTFGPDGRTLASASYDTTVRLWDVASGQERRVLEGHTDLVRSVSFSPDGLTLASGGGDAVIRLWGVASGQLLRVLEGHTDVTRAIFSPDGQTLVSGSYDQTIRLWDTHTWQLRRVLAEQPEAVRYLAYSPDGQLLAATSDDGTIQLLDAATGQTLRLVQGHTLPVRSLAFSPDGRLLISGGDDGTVWLWVVASGAPVGELKGHTERVLSVAFSADGRYVASAGDDMLIRLWQVPAP